MGILQHLTLLVLDHACRVVCCCVKLSVKMMVILLLLLSVLYVVKMILTFLVLDVVLLRTVVLRTIRDILGSARRKPTPTFLFYPPRAGLPKRGVSLMVVFIAGETSIILQNVD